MNALSVGFQVLSHIGLLLHTEKDVQTIAEEIFRDHKEKFPSKDEAVELVNDALSLLDAFGTGIPAATKDAITAALNQVLNLASGSPNVPPPAPTPGPAPAPAAA